MSGNNGTTSQASTSKTTAAPVEYSPKDVRGLLDGNAVTIAASIDTLNETLQTIGGILGHIRDAAEAMAIRYHGQWYPERMRAVAVPFNQWQAMDEIERQRVKADAKAQGRDVRIIPSTGAMSPEDFDAANLAL